jgi:DNA-3-methyladenine glycosylase II
MQDNNNIEYSKDLVNNGIRHLKENDQVLSSIITMVGEFTLVPDNDYFNHLVRIIIGQQLSLKVAQSIFSRVKNNLKNEITPEKVIHSGKQELINCGLSNNKVNSIFELSNKILQRELMLDQLPSLSNDEIFDQLIVIKGIGPWTIHNYLIFVLVRLNVLPIGDLAFRRAIKLNYKMFSNPSEEIILELSNNWGSYQTIAAWYLWETINQGIVK